MVLTTWSLVLYFTSVKECQFTTRSSKNGRCSLDSTLMMQSCGDVREDGLCIFTRRDLTPNIPPQAMDTHFTTLL